VAWDVLACGPFFTLTDPYGIDRTPIPQYPDLNAVELRVAAPTAGIWTLSVHPLPQLAGKDVGIVIDLEQPVARVLFDATHDEWFAANGDWSTFAEELRQASFQVDVLTSGPITANALAPYDVFVFGGWAHIPLSSAELAAVNQFVQNGGGLLLSYDEHTPSIYNPIASYYGVNFIDEAGLNDPTDDEPGSSAPALHVFSTHPLFFNVNSVQFYWVHYLSQVNQPSAGILFTDGDTVDRYGNLAAYKPMVAVAELGNGRVVSISDANLWNSWDWDSDGSADLYDRDNLQFGLNVIAWLGEVTPRPALNALANQVSEYEQAIHSSTPKEGSLNGRPSESPIVVPASTQTTALTDLAREHEEAIVNGTGNVSDVVNTIALYGNGSMTVTDTVPAGAVLTFRNVSRVFGHGWRKFSVVR